MASPPSFNARMSEISDSVAASAALHCEVEHLLFELNLSNIEETCVAFLSALSGAGDFAAKFLPRLFVNVLRIRIGAIEALSLFLATVAAAAAKGACDELREFPAALLRELFHWPLSDTTHFETAMQTVFSCDTLFLLRCVEAGVYSSADVVARIRERYFAHPTFDFDALVYFAWFAPEIEELDTDLLGALEASLKQTRLKLWRESSLDPFLSGKEELQENGWEKLKRLRQIGSDYSSAILRDDVEALHAALVKNSGSVCGGVFPTIYERFGHISKLAVSLVQLACMFGAVKCFKFLDVQGAPVEIENTVQQVQAFGRFHVGSRRPTLDFLVFGGSTEIVRCYQQKGCQFVGTLRAAVEAHQMHLYQWIAEHYEDPGKVLDDMVGEAIVTQNVEVLMELLKQKRDLKLGQYKQDQCSLVSLVLTDFMKQK